MKRILTLSLFVLMINACTNNTSIPLKSDELMIKTMLELHNFACVDKSRNSEAWGKNSLYDCKSQKLYIPYQLWTGAIWDGNKTNSCMHTANSAFNVDGDSPTTIKGPRDWRNNKSGKTEQIWARDKVDGSKSQYFTCHEKGIGRVYDSRRARTYLSGRCKFPAGDSWVLAKRGYCKNTSIEIIDLVFNNKGVLQSMRFKWWTGGNFDHIYRYLPNYGMSDAWKQ